MKDCHVVVEAAFESMPVKQAIFQQLDQIVTSPHALLLSNTSTLSVDEIASVVSPQRRSQVAGMHFFSPAHLMKLVEIVVGSNDHTTSPHTALQVSRLTKSLSKVGVTVGNCEGFVGNRMLFPYTAEMCHIVIDTATSISDVDAAILQLGVALGPFMMSDLAGNDIGYVHSVIPL
jgi:3-hydroxyacyl-CoA dehydrogenase